MIFVQTDFSESIQYELTTYFFLKGNPIVTYQILPEPEGYYLFSLAKFISPSVTQLFVAIERSYGLAL